MDETPIDDDMAAEKPVSAALLIVDYSPRSTPGVFIGAALGVLGCGPDGGSPCSRVHSPVQLLKFLTELALDLVDHACHALAEFVELLEKIGLVRMRPFAPFIH